MNVPLVIFFYSIIFVLMVVISVIYPEFVPGNILLPVMVGVTSVYFGIMRVITDIDNISYKLFTDFNTRFKNLHNDLNKISDQKTPLTLDERNVVLDFFNLSSEEYYWMKKNRIDKNVWKAWEKGILYYLKKENIKRVFYDEIKEDESYYGFLLYIKEKLVK